MKKILSIILCLSLILGLAAVASAAGETAGLVTSESKLANGQQVVILNNDFTRAMSVHSENGKYRTDMEATTSSNHSTVTVTDGMAVVTLEKSDNKYALKVDGQYLVCLDDGNNVKLQAEPYYWTITINEGGMASIICDHGDRELQYNSSSPRFACYKGTQNSVSIYVIGYTGDVPVSAPTDPKQIVDQAFALADGEKLPYVPTLTGVITKIDTPFDANWGNISVVISVEGTSGVKELLCYRLKGDGADALAVGDTITVTGTVKNYGGIIEFDSGCTLDNVVKGTTPDPEPTPEVPSDPKEIVDAAFALEAGEKLPYKATLTGVISEIKDPYSEQYKNITVVIKVEGTTGTKDLVVFRVKGEGAETLAVGDTITVTGELTNYNGTIEFNSGCTLDNVVKGTTADPSNPKDGDSISVFVALMAVSAVGAAVIIKKKEF